MDKKLLSGVIGLVVGLVIVDLTRLTIYKNLIDLKNEKIVKLENEVEKLGRKRLRG